MSRESTADEVLVRGLYQEHGAALMAYATRLTGDRGKASEIAQRVLLEAGRDPAALAAGRSAVRAHLFGLARGEPLGAARVLNVLDTLPEEERDVLHEWYFQGRDVKETAKSLGVPEATVKARGQAALSRLREVIG